MKKMEICTQEPGSIFIPVLENLGFKVFDLTAEENSQHPLRSDYIYGNTPPGRALIQEIGITLKGNKVVNAIFQHIRLSNIFVVISEEFPYLVETKEEEFKIIIGKNLGDLVGKEKPEFHDFIKAIQIRV